MSTPTQPALTRAKIHETLWRLAVKQTNKDPSQIEAGSRMIHDLGADSLAMVEFGMELEEELGITPPEEPLENPEVTLGEIEERLCALFAQG